MAQRVMTLSDFNGQVVDDNEHVSIVVAHHPALEGKVRLDAAESDIKNLKGLEDFAILEIHRQRGGSETLVVEIPALDALFSGDPQEALEGAERLQERPDTPAGAPRRRGRPPGSTNRPTAGQKPTTDKEQLQAARVWLRAQGHEVSDRGRIKGELMQLYLSQAGKEPAKDTKDAKEPGQPAFSSATS